MDYVEDVNKLNEAGDSEYVPIDASGAALANNDSKSNMFI